MRKSIKRSVVFFLVVLCGVGFLRCQQQRELEKRELEEITKRVEKREREFMKKQEEYFKEHGHRRFYILKEGRYYEGE